MREYQRLWVPGDLWFLGFHSEYLLYKQFPIFPKIRKLRSSLVYLESVSRAIILSETKDSQITRSKLRNCLIPIFIRKAPRLSVGWCGVTVHSFYTHDLRFLMEVKLALKLISAHVHAKCWKEYAKCRLLSILVLYGSDIGSQAIRCKEVSNSGSNVGVPREWREWTQWSTWFHTQNPVKARGLLLITNPDHGGLLRKSFSCNRPSS